MENVKNESARGVKELIFADLCHRVVVVNDVNKVYYVSVKFSEQDLIDNLVEHFWYKIEFPDGLRDAIKGYLEKERGIDIKALRDQKEAEKEKNGVKVDDGDDLPFD